MNGLKTTESGYLDSELNEGSEVEYVLLCGALQAV